MESMNLPEKIPKECGDLCDEFFRNNLAYNLLKSK
jgi:hypothetical protein